MGNFKDENPKIPLQKVIWFNFKRITKYIIMYPFYIRRIYGARKASIFMMLKLISSQNLRLEMKRLGFLVNFFINIPMFLSFILLCFFTYFKLGYIERYLDGLFSPLKSQGIFALIEEVFNRAFLGLKFFPFSITEFLLIIGAYMLSVIGARFLSTNKFFDDEKKCQTMLLDFKKLGEDGVNPWRVTITDEAILFDAYKHNPETFVKNVPFWNSLGFSPGIPLIYDENRRLFLIPKKRKLPPKIKLSMKGINMKELEEKNGRKKQKK